MSPPASSKPARRDLIQMRNLLPIVVLLCGCDIYFDRDHDAPDVPTDPLDTPCREPGPGAGQMFRDPQTGECHVQPATTSCTGTTSNPFPDWAECYGARDCEGLDELSCRAEPGCRAAYTRPALLEVGPDGRPTGGPWFEGCWEVAPSGPAQGSCAGLDAHECSRHDDCLSYFAATSTQPFRMFASCEPESTPLPSCELLATGAQCTPRSDCRPVYEGVDCTCYPDGCECAGMNFERCEPRR
ncbi:MAG: hypothetical protein AB7O24_29705 [Kofleriaceae bacterium]